MQIVLPRNYYLPCVFEQESKLYGAHFKEIAANAPKATKITFDSDDEWKIESEAHNSAIAYGPKQTCLFDIDYQFLANSFFQCQTSSAFILSVSKY